MSPTKTYEELVQLALERAATEVETWKPEDIGDHIAGKVIENGSISTDFGEYATTTFENDKGTFRTAWMGAVLQAQFRRNPPQAGDIVAFHYQKDVEPKTKGYNAYKLVVAVVIDPDTARSRQPINLDITVPTETQLANVDPRTGEIPPSPYPAGQAPVFEPFPDEDEDETTS